MPFLRREKFPTKLFVIAALGNFILLMFLFLSLKFSLSVPQTDKGENYQKSYKNLDPLITRVSGFKDIIDGPIINNIDPSLGPEAAPVTITYFADYQCQYCQGAKTQRKAPGGANEKRFHRRQRHPDDESCDEPRSSGRFPDHTASGDGPQCLDQSTQYLDYRSGPRTVNSPRH